MRVNALLLADTAELVEDRLTMTGGDWDGLTATAWPAGHPIQVVALLAPSTGDVGQDLPVVVRVLDPAGADSGATEATIRIDRHRAQLAVVLPVFGEFEGPGGYRVRVDVAGAQAEIAFVVEGPPADVRVPPSQP